MTLANKITVARILAIPLFVFFAVYYADSLARGTPLEWLRFAAILIFVFAAASDGVDGYVARRFNQRTRLGSILDPIADKGLLLAAIVTLTLSPWESVLPLWFPILVISRDLMILTGCAVLHWMRTPLEVRPTPAGKAATALQMIAIAWIMLHFGGHLAVVALAGLVTLASGIEYIVRGIALLPAGHPPHE